MNYTLGTDWFHIFSKELLPLRDVMVKGYPQRLRDKKLRGILSPFI